MCSEESASHDEVDKECGEEHLGLVQNVEHESIQLLVRHLDHVTDPKSRPVCESKNETRTHSAKELLKPAKPHSAPNSSMMELLINQVSKGRTKHSVSQSCTGNVESQDSTGRKDQKQSESDFAKEGSKRSIHGELRRRPPQGKRLKNCNFLLLASG